MDLQMYTDIGLNCILLLTVFRVFNLYISSLTMQGAFPIEGNSSLCAEVELAQVVLSFSA